MRRYGLVSIYWPAGFVVGVGVWVFWSHHRHAPADEIQAEKEWWDVAKHAVLSAAAFALYTMSFGSHSALLQQIWAVPDKVVKAVEGVLMLSFPMLMKLFGNTNPSSTRPLPRP